MEGIKTLSKDCCMAVVHRPLILYTGGLFYSERMWSCTLLSQYNKEDSSDQLRHGFSLSFILFPVLLTAAYICVESLIRCFKNIK